MECRQARNQILSECDGTASAAERAELEAHVTSCTACQQFRATLAGAIDSWVAGARHIRVPPPEIEWQKVRRILTGSSAGPRRGVGLWFALPTAGAAAIAALLIYYSPDSPSTPAPANPPVAATETSAASTVVYVDDQSGWTFVLSPDAASQKS